MNTISIVAAATLSGLASAHSWVHCTDYRGDTTHYEPNECFGNPRPLDGKVPGMTPFGTDTGFNQQPGATMCHSTESQHPSYPMATYQRGQQITLAWPTKNHVAATCTNAFIPDTSLELFAAPFTGTDTVEPTWSQVPASFSDKPHKNGQMDFEGFQKCPDFCNNMDKSLCTGTFIVPQDMADGTYTFQWRWEFNKDTSPYVTCFEAKVSGDFTGVLPTPAPTDESTPVTAPTEAPRNCGDEWSGCAGAGAQYDCCNAGLTCFKKDDWYSQCRVSCPTGESPSWECEGAVGPAPTPTPVEAPTPAPVDPTEPPVAAPTAPTMCTETTQLGGKNYQKKMNAKSATNCWEKCQANKTNGQCLGWEWVEGESKPCRLYTEVATSVQGLRECHPTLGLSESQ